MMTTSGWVITALLLGGQPAVQGNGKLKDEVRPTGAVTGIAVSGIVDADVRIGPETKVTIRADENLLPLLKTLVDDGVLKVEYSDKVRPTRVELKVVTPKLEKAHASGGAHLRAQASPGKKLEVGGSGGAELDIRGIDADRLDVALSGGVTARLSGKARVASVDASGGVELDAFDLRVDVADVDAGGGSRASLHVSRSLRGDASGGATVKVKGRPVVEVDRSGGAAVSVE